MKPRRSFSTILSLTASLFFVGSPSIHAQMKSSPDQATDSREGTSPCDWKSVKGSLSQSKLRLTVSCYEDIDFTKGAAYIVFLDTDQNPETGFQGPGGTEPVGADYMIQGATLYLYEGDGTQWYWNEAQPGVGEADGKDWEIEIDLKKLGKTFSAIDFFCLGDNTAKGVGGEGQDLLPDDAYSDGDRLTLKK